MLDLSIKEKEQIGKLFKYYRKKKNIQWKHIQGAISTSTYSNMEKGKAYKDTTLYDEVFCLYKIQYGRKENFEAWMNDYLIRLNDILEYYKEELFDAMIQELETELGQYKQTIFYEQYYEVLTYILDYYKYSKYMTLQEIEDCFELFECIEFEDTIMIYLLETMMISNNNSINNQQLFEKTYEKSLEYKDFAILWYVQAAFFKTKVMFETSLNLFNKSYEYYCQESNNYRTTKALMGKYVIYTNIDTRKAGETTVLLIQLKKEKKLYQSMVPNINFNIGMYYYLNNDYEKAYLLFMENIKDYQRKREWYYVCAICTQLNISIPKEFEDYNVQENEDPLIMEYFIMKYHNIPNKLLVDYIMKTILPKCLIHEKYQQPYWSVFEEELFAFSKKDKRFVDTFLEFLDIEKKTCKKC